MSNENWVGPWYSRQAQLVKGGTVITGEIFEYRRHVLTDGVFKTERIGIEKWWELGYRYKHLPKEAI
ncbi:unnamed protein product [marine sediment metagenome]|uniref:Uncharacterized protein n=1 Tax=marine sediment metagenome TaxID=412755 RepID=X0XLX9_9ZZZZ